MKLVANVLFAAALVAGTANVAQAAGDAEAGKNKSAVCGACHGADGNSAIPNFPKLAGQVESYTIKQLKDMKSGDRQVPEMAGIVPGLSEQDMADLAAYYAYLPRLPGFHPDRDKPAPRIVINGAPLRNIAPCGSCHGVLDNKTGSPWLEGQPAAYVKSQLQAFASGTRRNDISQQMRNIARKMTPEEIDQAAEWYASQPSTTIHTQ